MVQPKTHLCFLHICPTSAPGMTQEFPSWDCPALLPKSLLILHGPEFTQVHRSQTPRIWERLQHSRVPFPVQLPGGSLCISLHAHTAFLPLPWPPWLHSSSFQQGLFDSLISSPTVGLGTGGSQDCSHSHALAKESEGIPPELQNEAVERGWSSLGGEGLCPIPLDELSQGSAPSNPRHLPALRSQVGAVWAILELNPFC